MAFLRRIHGYHYLAITLRSKGKVVQKTRYLGKKIPYKAQLERLIKEFKAQVHEGTSRYLTIGEIAQIEKKKEEYQQEMDCLSLSGKEKRFEEFSIRFTYDSTKLSGLDVTLRQTSLILKDGIIPKYFRNLRTIREIENHQKGVVAVCRHKGAMDLAFLRRLHSIIFAGVDDSIAGKLRSELHKNVRIAGTAFVPPLWENVDKELSQFFTWYSSECRRLHPVELAALVHARLITLQPFADGNSRLSRLLMNWILWKKGFPMVDIPVEDIESYYDAVDAFQIERKELPFVRYIAQKFLEMP
jgi:Fic family protein